MFFKLGLLYKRFVSTSTYNKGNAMTNISELIGQHILLKVIFDNGEFYETGEVLRSNGVFYVSNCRIEKDVEIQSAMFRDCKPSDGFVYDTRSTP